MSNDSANQQVEEEPHPYYDEKSIEKEARIRNLFDSLDHKGQGVVYTKDISEACRLPAHTRYASELLNSTDEQGIDYDKFRAHVISKEELSIDSKKVKAILNLLIPKDVSNIRSFMRITRYYGRLIERFSELTYTITSLQNKGVKFEWTPKCQEILEMSKYMLTVAPALNNIDP